MFPAIATKIGLLAVMAMEATCPLLERSEGVLKRSQQLTRQQRQAERIAPRRHLLLSSCIHVKSLYLMLVWCSVMSE